MHFFIQNVKTSIKNWIIAPCVYIFAASVLHVLPPYKCSELTREACVRCREKMAEWPRMTGWPQWFDACCSSSPGESRQRQRQAAPPAARVPRRHTGHCSCRGLHQVWQVPDRRDRWGGSYWLERWVWFSKRLSWSTVSSTFSLCKNVFVVFLTLGLKEYCSGFKDVRRKTLKVF